MSDDKAKHLLQQAIEFEEQGNAEQAIIFYNKVVEMAANWSVPYYNLGLLYKYQGEWGLSYTNNLKALEFEPNDEAARWNLGIAATALNDWLTARQSWNYFGLNLDVNDEEPRLNLSKAPVRLNPNDDAEVVWCTRIDPARAVIDNIPLSSCGHRYGDMVLNDGAPVGVRISDGKEYPVFNELQLLEKSKYSTYSITVYTNAQNHVDKLIELCKSVNVEVEDWSTIRILCKQCSEGIPHEYHDDKLKESLQESRYIGFASLSKQVILNALSNWRSIFLCEHSELILELE